MTDWIRTPTTKHSPLWEDIDLPKRDDPKDIGVLEWINVSTGAAFLLVPKGSWLGGGTFVLYWLAPGAAVAVEMTHLIAGTLTGFEEDDPENWTIVSAGLGATVDAFLGVEPRKHAEKG